MNKYCYMPSCHFIRISAVLFWKAVSGYHTGNYKKKPNLKMLLLSVREMIVCITRREWQNRKTCFRSDPSSNYPSVCLSVSLPFCVIHVIYVIFFKFLLSDKGFEQKHHVFLYCNSHTVIPIVRLYYVTTILLFKFPSTETLFNFVLRISFDHKFHSCISTKPNIRQAKLDWYGYDMRKRKENLKCSLLPVILH